MGECNLFVGVRRFFFFFVAAVELSFFVCCSSFSSSSWRTISCGLRSSSRAIELERSGSGADKIVVVVGFPDRRGHVCHAGHDRSIARRRFAHHAVRDPIGESLTVSHSPRRAALRSDWSKNRTPRARREWKCAAAQSNRGGECRGCRSSFPTRPDDGCSPPTPRCCCCSNRSRCHWRRPAWRS